MSRKLQSPKDQKFFVEQITSFDYYFLSAYSMHAGHCSEPSDLAVSETEKT